MQGRHVEILPPLFPKLGRRLSTILVVMKFLFVRIYVIFYVKLTKGNKESCVPWDTR